MLNNQELTKRDNAWLYANAKFNDPENINHKPNKVAVRPRVNLDKMVRKIKTDTAELVKSVMKNYNTKQIWSLTKRDSQNIYFKIKTIMTHMKIHLVKIAIKVYFRS